MKALLIGILIFAIAGLVIFGVIYGLGLLVNLCSKEKEKDKNIILMNGAFALLLTIGIVFLLTLCYALGTDLLDAINPTYPGNELPRI